MERSHLLRCTVFFFLLFLFCGSRLPAAEDSISLPEKTFEFPPVLDGENVRHDFTVINRGQNQVDILEVKPDCGCTTVSYPPRISPGGRGKIVIMLNTSGFGGEHVVKTINVRTNDRDKPSFALVMAGDVRPFAVIDPPEVNLTGNAGTKIERVVSITPIRENPFVITEVKTEKGKDLHCELTQVKGPGGIKYRLTVRNTRQDKGWYIDHIYLKTTSRKSPVLKIRVLGMIR
jgi:hypothetical protein